MTNTIRVPANNFLSGLLVAMLLLLGVVAAGVFLFWGSASWAGLSDRVLSGAIFLAALATVVNARRPTVAGRLVISVAWARPTIRAVRGR